MSIDKYASAGEAKLIRRMVNYILLNNFTISIDDGEEITVVRSHNRKEIYASMATTGEDRLLIHNGTGKHSGTFWLVYGNDPSGEELIADYSGNPLCDDLFKYFMEIYE